MFCVDKVAAVFKFLKSLKVFVWENEFKVKNNDWLQFYFSVLIWWRVPEPSRELVLKMILRAKTTDKSIDLFINKNVHQVVVKNWIDTTFQIQTNKDELSSDLT